MNVFIYTLADPISGEIRYVGKTIDLGMRLQAHMDDRNRTYKTGWIKSLKKKSMKPVMEVLEVVENSNDEDWQEVERFYVDYLRFLGFRLCNEESGGESGKRLSVATKERLKAVHKARFEGPDADANRDKMANNRGKKLSDEWRAKISAAIKGRKIGPKSEDHKEKLRSAALRQFNGQDGEVNRAKIRTYRLAELNGPDGEKFRAKMREMRIKRGPIVLSAEALERVRKAHIGSKRSNESRAKMSAAAKRRWAPKTHFPFDSAMPLMSL